MKKSKNYKITLNRFSAHAEISACAIEAGITEEEWIASLIERQLRIESRRSASSDHEIVKTIKLASGDEIGLTADEVAEDAAYDDVTQKRQQQLRI